MLVRDIIKYTPEWCLVEIANKYNYYYGKVKNIPEDVLDLKVVYMVPGNADTNGAPNTLLIDAE